VSLLLQKLLRVLPWILTALIAAMVVILVMLPAAWFTPMIARATANRIHFSLPAGSIWQGSATLMLAAGANPVQGLTALPGRIEWRTAFWPLLTGRVHMLLYAREAMPKAFELTLTPRQALLSAGRLTLPASLLTGLGAPFNTLALQGDIQLEWNKWRLSSEHPSGELMIHLNNMASRVSPVRPLGSYRIAIQATGRQTTFELITTKGVLLLDGRGQWQQHGKFSFQGTARAQEAEYERLRGLLTLLGPAIGNQTYALNL
jgi:general secretion pathway protein N